MVTIYLKRPVKTNGSTVTYAVRGECLRSESGVAYLEEQSYNPKFGVPWDQVGYVVYDHKDGP